MTAKIVIVCASVILCAAAIFTMTSCKAERFRVICSELFENVKDSYKAGERVKINFPFVATDTDYSFFIDGEALNGSYDEQKGYVFEFTMPDHDVNITFESKNSMVYTPLTPEPGTVLITYRDKILSTADAEQDFYQITITATETEWEHLALVRSSDRNDEEYIIPASVYQSLVNYAENSWLEDWNHLEEPLSLEGRLISFGISIDGEYLEISSDSMPQDGETVLEYLRLSIADYLTADNMVK